MRPRAGPATPLPTALAALALATSAAAQVERYRLTVENTWSEATHPGAFPPLAHFSWLGGGTHAASVSFWRENALASPGIVQMAETGATFVLESEVAAAIMRGAARSVLAWHDWFCPAGTNDPQCRAPVVEFDVDAAFPLVTLVTMLGPSPDWFVGVGGLALHDGTRWLDRVVVDLPPFDGGTRSANAFALGGPLTIPAAPIARITAASGQLIGPASLGAFRFERVGALGAFGCETPAIGHGAPTLAITRGEPRIGTTFDLTIANPSPTATAASLGFQVFAAPTPSPQHSALLLGLCWNLPLPFGGVFVPVPTSTVVSLAVPSSSSLSGAAIDWQVLALDLASTSTGLAITASRGLTTRLR